LRDQVKVLKEEHGIIVGLGVLIVGDRKDSQTYVRMKKKAAEAANVHIQVETLAGDATQVEILAAVDGLVADSKIHGVLVQVCERKCWLDSTSMYMYPCGYVNICIYV
jgi:5,10-methylene-tetrahydrofolate dehydrogenase/methenyl tetrahydrofolate cyclohydrolase